MWKPEHRLVADRSGLRYPSDLTDPEWAIVQPMIPPARQGGRKRSVNVREVLNGIFYILWTGCQWKALPKDLPPKSTVHDYLELWNWDAGKKIKGRKRHILVDTLGLLLSVATFRIVMEHSIFCAGRADCSRSSSAFLPMADMPETRWRSSCGAPGHGS